MANSLTVVIGCTAQNPDGGSHTFAVNDTILPSSSFYWQMLWSGNAVDSGNPVAGPVTPVTYKPVNYTGVAANGSGVRYNGVSQQWEVLAKNPALSAPQHLGPAFAVLQATSKTDMTTAKTAGCTHAIVQIPWETSQASVGAAVVITTALQQITDALSVGLKICLEVQLQYPPSFVQSGVPAFKDQAANLYTATQNTGNNVRDWVFSKTGRGYVSDFLNKVFAQLPWVNIERVRLGGLTSGELQFPPSASTTVQWWGFSAPAQTGTDLAAGQSVCPVPAHTPTPANTTTGASNGWSSDDQTFITWYQQSLINWMTWYIAQYRKYFDGRIYVLHPGAGLRPVSQIPTSTTQANNFQISIAAGLDWGASIAAYSDNNVWPYSTWADSAPFWSPAPYDPVADGNAPPWYTLIIAARKYGRSGHMWGENTGGQANSDMDRMFLNGAIPFGYEGCAWLGNTQLVAGGANATYANFTTRVATILSGN